MYSIFERNIRPIYQALGILIMVFLMDGVIYLTKLNGPGYFKLETYWTVAIAMALFYIVINCLLYVYASDLNGYWRNSVFSYVGLCLVSGGLAYLFSGLSIDDAGSYRWIFLVFTVGYMLFLAIIRTMRWIVLLAQREDSRMHGEN